MVELEPEGFLVSFGRSLLEEGRFSGLLGFFGHRMWFAGCGPPQFVQTAAVSAVFSQDLVLW